MATISAGTSRTFTASANGATFTVSINGGSIAVISGGASDQIGPIATRKTYGPFAIGQTLTVASQSGDVLVDFGDATPQDSLAVNLYDPATGRWLGVIDKAGNEQRVEPAGATKYVLLNGRKLPRTRRGIGRVVGGTGRWRIGLVGDSTTAGAGAGSSGTTNIVGSALKSFPYRLASRLATIMGSTGQMAAVEGGVANAGSATISQYNANVTLGGGAAAGVANYACPTGQMITMPVSGTYALAPGYSFDTLEFGYVQNAGLGTFTPTVASGTPSPSTIACTGGLSCQKGTFTFSAANTSVTLTDSVATSYIGWTLAYDSTKTGVDVFPLCKWGGVINDFGTTTNVWSTGVVGMYNTMALDTIIIQLTINDSNNGTALATYLTKLQTFITLLSGLTNAPDIILMSGWPSNTAAATNGTLASFQQGIAALAVTNGIPYISFGEGRVGDYSTFSDWYSGDGIHILPSGYGAQGDFVARALLDMAS